MGGEEASQPQGRLAALSPPSHPQGLPYSVSLHINLTKPSCLGWACRNISAGDRCGWDQLCPGQDASLTLTWAQPAWGKVTPLRSGKSEEWENQCIAQGRRSAPPRIGAL